MTANEFRRLALALPEAVESEHMSHPDFRVGGRIFATLMPGGECGMLKLTPDQQRMLIKAEPEVFAPIKGGWGVGGATQVVLKKAKKASVKEALNLAWQGTAPKKLRGE
jgi:hypothetical protein